VSGARFPTLEPIREDDDVLIHTRGRPLTAADFERDVPAPGSSDVRYSKEFLETIELGFAPWIEDPDPPDRMSEEQIKKLAEGACRLLGKN
jgi:hypothetical protein